MECWAAARCGGGRWCCLRRGWPRSNARTTARRRVAGAVENRLMSGSLIHSPRVEFGRGALAPASRSQPCRRSFSRCECPQSWGRGSFERAESLGGFDVDRQEAGQRPSHPSAQPPDPASPAALHNGASSVQDIGICVVSPPWKPCPLPPVVVDIPSHKKNTTARGTGIIVGCPCLDKERTGHGRPASNHKVRLALGVPPEDFSESWIAGSDSLSDASGRHGRSC